MTAAAVAAGTGRQGAEQAIQLAIESKWEEAATLNRSILEALPEDVDTWNRLGKSLLELGRFREAHDAYARSIELDPVNQIAKRNLERLEGMEDAEGGQQIAITEEERAAIERLAALGFDFELAAEAFFACEKNEEMAANYLLGSGGGDWGTSGKRGGG